MATSSQIEVVLIRLANGERLLRLSDSATGLSLEKKLDPRQPVARQKERLRQAFEAALARTDSGRLSARTRPARPSASRLTSRPSAEKTPT